MIQHKVKIETHGTTGHLYIDGKEVSGIQGYTIEHNAGEIPAITLRLSAADAEIVDGFSECCDGGRCCCCKIFKKQKGT